jgi:hypothetical protein
VGLVDPLPHPAISAEVKTASPDVRSLMELRLSSMPSLNGTPKPSNGYARRQALSVSPRHRHWTDLARYCAAGDQALTLEGLDAGGIGQLSEFGLAERLGRRPAWRLCGQANRLGVSALLPGPRVLSPAQRGRRQDRLRTAGR